MTEPRRINLRVDEEEFRKLDDKRHAERTTFQQVGLQLLREWLAGPAASAKDHREANMTSAEAAVVARVLAVLRSGNRDAIKGLHAALEIGEMLLEALGKGKRK